MVARISVIAAILFGAFSFQSIYPGDAGDLVTAAWLGGIPHPPGYPLYTFLGWLITHMPWSTPAWRMAWLSSIPHALTVGIVSLLVYRWTKSTMSALFAALLLAGNYLFFLYSITPEVFALLDLFIVSLVYVAIKLQDRFSWKTAIFFFFMIGLSIAHHHMVVFLFPPLFFFVRPVFTRQKWTFGNIGRCISAMVLGLLPYLYIVWAASGNSIINWDRPTTLSRFIQLFTRADYGTFVSGGAIGESLYQRLLNVQAFVTFLGIDFTWIGILLACAGFFWLWKHKRRVFYFLFSSFLLLGPGFMFYASFSIINRFVLGTYERFMLPSYVIVAIAAGIGVWVVCERVAVVFARRALALLCFLVLLLYPLTVSSMTIWRFWGSSTDQTTDLFLKDLLGAAPTNAIILLSHDTPLFGGQYMRYALNFRPDTTVLHLSRLPLPDYHEVIAMTNPDIVLPAATGGLFVGEFIEVNAKHRPIASNSIIPTSSEWVWVPHGLLYVLTKKDEVPDTSTLVLANDRLWSSFHDPTTGLLSRYNHLMLSNVRDEYATTAVEYGKLLIKADNLKEAKKQFLRATQYESDAQREAAWIYLGLSQLFLRECDEALDSFARAKKEAFVPNPDVLQYEAITYRDCVHDVQRADELYKKYELLKRQKEQPLEQL